MRTDGALGAMPSRVSGSPAARLRELVDDVCSPVVVSRAGSAVADMPVNLAGDYLEAGFTTGNRPVFYKSSNGTAATDDDGGGVGDVFENSESVMYWTSGVAVAAGGEVQLRSGAGGGPTFGWGMFSEPDHHHHRHYHHGKRRDVPRDAANHRGPGGKGDKAVKEFIARKQEKAETLAACTTGGWMLRESVDSYPAYLVMDCAVHPVEISSGIWYTVTSRDAAAEPIDASFSMVCYEPESEDDDSWYGWYDDDWYSWYNDDFYGGSDDSQPAPGPITNSPAVQILDIESFPTIAPGATVVVGAAGSDHCVGQPRKRPYDFPGGPSSSSPGVDDPLAWGTGASLTSSTSTYPTSSTTDTFLPGDSNDDMASDRSDVTAAEGDGSSSDGGVTEGLLISGGLFLAVTFAGAIGAALWIGHKRKRRPSGAPAAVPPAAATTGTLETREAAGITAVSNDNNNESEAEAGRYFSKLGTHHEREVANVTTAAAAAATINMSDGGEEKGDEGYGQVEKGKGLADEDAGVAGGDVHVPSTVAAEAQATAPEAATARDDVGGDAAQDGDALQSAEDGQEEPTARGTAAGGEPEAGAETEVAAETEAAAAPAEVAPAEAAGDNELKGNEEAPGAAASEKAESPVEAASTEAVGEAEGGDGGKDEEEAGAAAAVAAPATEEKEE
ncbi:unnamed protein product [Scytosiphon promiscuus]